MNSLEKNLLLLFVILLFLLIQPSLSLAAEAGKITGVKLSPDSRKLLIKFEGDVGTPQSFSSRNPTKLVIDFKAGLGMAPASQKFPNKALQEIRVGKSGAGARVEVDFGRHGAPDHRIRRIDDCFIVFLGDIKPKPPAEAPSRPPNAREKTATAAPQRWKAVPAATGMSGLFIKSAEVIEGLIVLEVADRKEPHSAYRIKLGVDLAQQGFNTAHIRRISEKKQDGLTLAARLACSSVERPRLEGERKGQRKDTHRVIETAKWGPTKAGHVAALKISEDVPWRDALAPAVKGCSFIPKDQR